MQKDQEIVPFFDRRNLVMNIQNTLSLCLAGMTLFKLCEYQYHNLDNSLVTACYIVGIHAIIDMFLCSKEVVLHHLCILSTIFYKVWWQVDNYHDALVMKTMLSTEFSTVFYVAKLWLDQYKKSINTKTSTTFNIVYGLNDSIFFASFFKLRIFDYYYNIISNAGFHYDMWDYYIDGHYIRALFLYFGVYGLYGLNLYWGTIILKKVFKTVISPMLPFLQEYKLNAQLLQYTFCVNFPIAANLYMNSGKYAIFDMLGIYVLCFFSYYCHNSKLKYVEHHNSHSVELTSSHVAKHYFLDVCAIQVRSFCALASIFSGTFETNYIFVYVSGLFHLLTIVNVSKYIINKLAKGKKIYLDNYAQMFPLEIMVALPSVVNTAFLIYYVDSIQLRAQLVMVTIWLAINLRMEPFYKFSYVMFHVGLMMQTYVLCKMNNYMNY